jgi:hypothetical protein
MDSHRPFICSVPRIPFGRKIARKELYGDFSPMKQKVKSISAHRRSTDVINNIRKLIIAGSRIVCQNLKKNALSSILATLKVI